MSNKLTLISGLNNTQYLRNDTQSHIYLYLELNAPKVDLPESRLPLNLGLVIDRSGSMHGEKLKRAKEALKFVINNMAQSDRFSLVQYDDRIDVLQTNTSLSNKAALLKLVDKITDRGATNLSGGMMEGFSQVAKHESKEGYVNRVLLLSDGLANRGVRDRRQVGIMAQTQYRELGISLSTFGIGADFDEDLMNQLAEFGGGNNHFIGTPEDIPNIFADELKGLLAVCAQNTSLHVDIPAGYFSLEKAFGYPIRTEGASHSVDVNDIFSEDRKAVLLKLKVLKPIDKTLEFKVRLSYDDVISEFKRIEVNESIQLSLAEDASAMAASYNRKVQEQVAIFESNAMHEAMLKLVEQRKFDDAKTAAQQLIGYIEAQLQHFPESTELRGQLKVTQELLEELGEMKNMDERSYKMTMKHHKSNSSYVRAKKADMMAARFSMRKKEKGS